MRYKFGTEISQQHKFIKHTKKRHNQVL